MEKKLSTRLLKFLAAAFAAGGLAAAQAQDFPAKPVKLVVWTAPGGSIDTLSRLIAEKLSPRRGLGSSVFSVGSPAALTEAPA